MRRRRWAGVLPFQKGFRKTCGKGCQQWCPGQGLGQNEGPLMQPCALQEPRGERVHLPPASSPSFSGKTNSLLPYCLHRGSRLHHFVNCVTAQRPGVSRFAFPGRLRMLMALAAAASGRTEAAACVRHSSSRRPEEKP